MICKELNKSFETKEDLFVALKAAKKDIVSAKKAQVLKSCEKDDNYTVHKLLDPSKMGTVKGLEMDSDYYYLAVNTTKILDSHGDLHVDGIWKETVKQRQGKNVLALDHKLEVKSVLVRKEYIEMFTAEIPFRSIGKDYDGNTEALIYKFKKSEVKDADVKEWLDSGDDIQASVRMQYVDIVLAMNSEREEDKAELKAYNDYSTKIANKAELEDEMGEAINYFWVVKEAKNVHESSLVVAGSNSATGLLEEKEEPSEDTQEEPLKSTQDIETIISFTQNLKK